MVISDDLKWFQLISENDAFFGQTYGFHKHSRRKSLLLSRVPPCFANRFSKIEPIGRGIYSIATQTGSVRVKRLSLFLNRMIDPKKM